MENSSPNPSFSICDFRIQKQVSRSFGKSFPQKIVLPKLRPHCSATCLNTWKAEPRKKNTPCFLDLAGVKFLLKVERTFFFGVLPSKYSGRWRNNADEVLAKLFFGEERICQNFGSFVFEFGCRKWKRRGLGRNFPFAPLVSFDGGKSHLDFMFTLYTKICYNINKVRDIIIKKVMHKISAQIERERERVNATRRVFAFLTFPLKL